MTAPVMPPATLPLRALSWKRFESLYAPVRRSAAGLLWEPCEVPADADARYWWTVVDHVPGRHRLYLVPGFRRANRLGHVCCAVPWGGEADQHPDYVY